MRKNDRKTSCISRCVHHQGPRLGTEVPVQNIRNSFPNSYSQLEAPYSARYPSGCEWGLHEVLLLQET